MTPPLDYLLANGSFGVVFATVAAGMLLGLRRTDPPRSRWRVYCLAGGLVLGAQFGIVSGLWLTAATAEVWPSVGGALVGVVVGTAVYLTTRHDWRPVADDAE